MAEDTIGNGAGGAPTTNPSEPQQLILNAQYVKDLSFEVPGAPQIFSQLHAQPQVNINLDVQARRVQEGQNVFEVALVIRAEAHEAAAAPAAPCCRPTARRDRCDEAGLRTETARDEYGRRAGTALRGRPCRGSRPARRWRGVVELGAGAGARRQPTHGPAGARRASGGRQSAVVRSRPGAALDDPAAAGIHDDLVTPGAAAQ